MEFVIEHWNMVGSPKLGKYIRSDTLAKLLSQGQGITWYVFTVAVCPDTWYWYVPGSVGVKETVDIPVLL